MTGEPVITGYGVFTAFGFGAGPLLDGAFAGRPAFGPVTRFDVGHYRGGHAAVYDGDETKLSTSAVGDGVPAGQHETFLRCAGDALALAGIDTPAPIPVLIGTQGDFTAITRFWASALTGTQSDDPAVARSLPALLPHEIGERLGLGRPRLAFTTACVASTNAIAHAAQMVSVGRADVVLCGGAYLVDEEVFAKFDTMRAFAKDGQVRPFCKTRSGLLLGDGVAALVVESAQRARARGAEPLACLIGWGMGADAYHVVQPHPEGLGMGRAVSAALRRARIAPDQLDYVNAHGTGTPTNDVAETAALRRALGQHAEQVPISSTKSTMGHQLEAAGAVQAVIAVLAMQHGVIPPTAGYTEPDPRCDLDYVPNQPRSAELHRVLTTSASFGGVNAALILERP